MEVACGIWYIPVDARDPRSLPLLSLNTDITLYPTFSRTVLKQHFKNPSTTLEISEAKYVFPLHNTQTITAFTCHVGEKTIKGIVQSKPKAKATYDAAVARGETAGLLSAIGGSDIWQSQLGNIPAGASVEVVITCIAQLQHDSEKDAIRFNLPTHIAPRYGTPPADVYTGASYSFRPSPRGRSHWQILSADTWVEIDGGMNIKVFVEMDAPIQLLEAPAHPSSVTMGTHSLDGAGSAEFDPKKAVLRLASDTTTLDKDFVVLVKTAKSGFPSAVIQHHSDGTNTAGLMLTLVPKFNAPVDRPEVVFLVDRSGSMSGNEPQLRKALAIFLQSLPVGCKFNVCSFGGYHKFLWSKSKSYSEATLKEAQAHISTITADMGGTEMYPPIKDTIERRYKDLNLEILLLTDGDIWQRDELMNYLQEQCKASSNAIRMFTLGIGNGISHALIDGLASVAGGYSQVVQLEEKLDSKVIRMLRAALGQHVNGYTLEFPDAGPVELVGGEYDVIDNKEALSKNDGREKTIIPEKTDKTSKDSEPATKTKISLFDSSADLDAPPEQASNYSNDPYSHLPALPKLPKRLQSPHVIPPLFAFSRTNVYVVFNPAPKVLPTVARLHAKTSSGADLELEIPILRIENGKDISQLAARSFLQELEDGKGYLHQGTIESLTKENNEGKWDEIVEREGVRWGEGFGVASKWTSFVAVEDNIKASEAPVVQEEAYTPPPPVSNVAVQSARVRKSSGSYDPYIPTSVNISANRSMALGLKSLPMSRTAQIQAQIDDTIGIMRDNINKTTERGQCLDSLQDKTSDLAVSAQGFRRGANRVRRQNPGMFLSAASFVVSSVASSVESATSFFSRPASAAAPSPSQPSDGMAPASEAAPSPSHPSDRIVAVGTASERVHSLIMLQAFAGSFKLDKNLATIIEASFKVSGVLQKLKDLAVDLGVTQDVVATWAAVVTFERGEGHASDTDTWVLVVEKATAWLEVEGHTSTEQKEKVAKILGA
ncbi:hypothetical protein ABW20_dc0105717 [Dactylellina cionopaga]|nr:hypothetical protein ABW20_dc0105717 [Dactylellina cionopaga]